MKLPFVPGPPLPPEPGAERIRPADSGECEGFSSVTIKLTPERFAREPVIAVNHIPERGDCWVRSEFRQRRDPPAGTVCRWTLKPSVTDGSLGMSRSMGPDCWGWISEAEIIMPAGSGIPPPDP